MQTVKNTVPCVVALDLGGTQLRTGIFTPGGDLQARWTVPSATELSALIDQVEQQVRVAESRSASPVAGVGISCFGRVHPRDGSVHGLSTVAGLSGAPLAELLRERLSIPVHIVNDANAATVAEWRRGAGRGTDDFCYVTVSTGVGCGIVSRGALLLGAQGFAGELGFMELADPVERTPVILEDLASGTAIAARAEERRAEFVRPPADAGITARDVAASAAAGDPLAVRLLQDSARRIARGLANLVRIVDPQRIALGGGVIQSGPVYWEALNAEFEEALAHDLVTPPELVRGEFVADAGLLGAALSLLDAHPDIAHPDIGEGV